MRRIAAIAVLAVMGIAGVSTAVLVSSSDSAADSYATCEQAVTELLQANRIVALSQSYRKDNPTEYAKVRAYLDGGVRPTGSLTHMGMGLVALEDTCRELVLPPPTTTVPPPTTTEPPPTTTEPPPPLPSNCTNTLSAGGDLSAFANSLGSGDVGCLREGTYNDGNNVSWSASGGTLRNYPGERPVVVGTRITMSGSDQTIQGFTIKDVLFADGEAIQIPGQRARVEEMELANTDEHGILLNTSARNVTITRNYIHDVGGDTLDHGIYVQGYGHVITNNLIVRPSGYGLHFYNSCGSGSIAAENALIGSRLRAGALIRCESGGGVKFVNNIMAQNATHGINFHSCAAGGCIVDTNLAWANASGATNTAGASVATNVMVANPLFVDSEYRVQPGSPAVDAARSDYSYSPDRDGVIRPQGAGPDLGAYEE